MIDLITENLIAFRDVPKYLPRRPNGKTVHVSAVYRWASSKGIKGGIRLESCTLGGTTYTSTQAIQRFAEALTNSQPDAPSPISHMTQTRQAQARRAEQEIRRQLGIADRAGRSPSTRMLPATLKPFAQE